jgi:phosphoglycolate/pyridoxal phosphate phosphatase family enzyme
MEKERLKEIKCFLFDMDGTIYLGNELLPGVADFFKKLKAAGKDYYFVTNNSSKGHIHYAKKLIRMGISAEPRDVVISSDALNYYLQKIRPHAKLYILGTEELKETIRNAGFTIVEDEQTTPDFVIVGFDMSLEYKTLAHSCRLIDKGVPFIATHGDVRCPIEAGEFIPDCGAMLALIKSATGKEPVNIMGKPNHYIIDLVREKANYEKYEIAMVGDRLSTDIAFGLNNNILSVLVLTGEATIDDVERTNIIPDIILNNVVEILDYI